MDKIVYRRLVIGELIRENDRVWNPFIHTYPFNPNEAQYTTYKDNTVIVDEYTALEYYRPEIVRVDNDDRKLEIEL